MSILRSLRPAAHAAGAALLLLAASLVPVSARAQPACESGTLTAYLAPDYACRIDGWVFEEFEYLTFADVSPSVTASTDDVDLLDVLPFRRVDADGHIVVGFDFLTFGSSLSTTGSQRGDERGTAVAQIQFYGRALSPSAGLIGARAELGATLDGTNPALSFFSSHSFAMVDDVFTDARCLDATIEVEGSAGSVFDELAGACGDEPALGIFALVGNVSRVDRDGDSRPGPLFGFTAGSVQTVTFVTAQVVPEPSTVVLMASGLLGLAAAARRQRASIRRAASPAPAAR